MASVADHSREAERVSVRRRGDALRKAIFDAVFAQLMEVGYTKLTMEGVAAAARTGKAALYRRWDSKDELVLDALQDVLPASDEVAVHDDLRSDLVALLRFVQTAFNRTHGTVFLVVAAEAGGDSGIVRSVINDRIVNPSRKLLAEALERGVRRGEVAREADIDLIADIGPAMLITQCLTDAALISDDYVTSVVEKVLLPLTRLA